MLGECHPFPICISEEPVTCQIVLESFACSVEISCDDCIEKKAPDMVGRRHSADSLCTVMKGEATSKTSRLMLLNDIQPYGAERKVTTNRNLVPSALWQPTSSIIHIKIVRWLSFQAVIHGPLYYRWWCIMFRTDNAVFQTKTWIKVILDNLQILLMGMIIINNSIVWVVFIVFCVLCKFRVMVCIGSLPRQRYLNHSSNRIAISRSLCSCAWTIMRYCIPA